MKDPLRIANCSGFFGDRIAAAREMIEGGPIDVLTGDYLAELTMAILWRTRSREDDGGYAGTFLTQMREVMASCLDRGVKVVANAGGLNPRGLAGRLRKMADELGLNPRIAFVEGDDLLPRLAELLSAGHEFRHLDRGQSLREAGVTPLTANAYLGGWAVKEALERGADVVVTGRITDAALVIGPAAWHFNWERDNWDALAGALVAGHIVECGAQATGGNYAFFEEVPGLSHPGFPIAEIHPDGSSVITKHPGTGGLVSVGTVTAQLLYEIDSTRYVNPDVVAHFDTIHLQQEAPDRVAVSPVVGSPPPPDLKVAINYMGGFKNTMTFGLAGLAVAEKAKLVEDALWESIGPPDDFEAVDVRLLGEPAKDPATNDEALAYLRVSVRDPDEEKVGRRFSRAAVELALAHYPGLFLTSPPGDASRYAVYWPAAVPATLVPARVVVGEEEWEVSSVAPATEAVATPQPPTPPAATSASGPPPGEGTTSVPLGRVAGARSGDKGGNANVGVWVRSAEAYRWLESYLTTERMRVLLPEAAELEIRRYELANLAALNFVFVGLLGEGVSSSLRTDPQAKSLGEFMRARWVDVPNDLLDPRG
ncbi:MAG TPA: acyclic terpene utilization AtuA family protein [Acidimicrobiia bacterium]